MKPTFTNDSATIGSTEYSLPADSTTLAAQTDDCRLQAFIDFSAMAAGDQYLVKLKEKVNGGTARPLWQAYLTGAQAELCVTPLVILGEGWDLTVQKIAGTDRVISWSLRKLVEGETVAAVTLATNAVSADAVAADAVAEFQAGLVTAAGLTSAVAPLALSTQVDALESGVVTALVDLDDIQARLPAALVNGRIDASVGELAAGIATELAAAVWAFAHETGRTAKGVLVRLDALMTGKATGLLGSLVTFFRADGVATAMEATQDTEAGTREAASTVAGD